MFNKIVMITNGFYTQPFLNLSNNEFQDLSMKTANENGSSVILANDPDADRLAIAEHQPE